MQLYWVRYKDGIGFETSDVVGLSDLQRYCSKGYQILEVVKL